MAFTHTHAATIPAAPARVFRALTDRADLRRWFAEDVQVEPRGHGVYRFWGRHTPGTPAREDARQTITRFDPDSTLGFSWPIHEVETDVVITLEPSGHDTRLTLSHAVSADLPVPRGRALVAEHWRAAIENLVTHLAGGRPVLPDYFRMDQSPR